MKLKKLKFEYLKVKLTANNLFKEARIRDEEGSIGTIIECEDLHNVFINFDDGGSALYCFIEDCEERKKYEENVILYLL